MQHKPFSYLFSISYFGARFKGWAKQPEQPTVEGKLERVLRFVLEDRSFTLIGSSRTDWCKLPERLCAAFCGGGNCL